MSDPLENVYWIGGGSGAGKSTVARRLARERGWRPYETDAVMGDHSRRTTPERAPFLHRFMAMGMDQRWVERSPRDMLETFHWFRGEGFDLMIEDLRAMPPGPPVVAEGFRLLPRLVAPLAAAGRAVWLLPTAEFRRAAFERRSVPGSDFVDRTSDPDRAMRNLAERDRMFTDRLRGELSRLDLRAIEIDTSMSEDQVFGAVVGAFGA
ncbi:hypothetical protein [Glycomyces salinus]|uniref:hypothetical protein n=1 Tax=Glycomyces salinus TaxID=980294 RepID=UPI0018EC9AC0|nr:hypothetical protein [Glycomyces salinus]